MLYNISTLSSILNLPAPETDRQVSVLLTDSRSLTYPEVSLFFAISTPNNDGHRYIRNLYEMGVKAFCVTHIPDDMADVTDASFLIVPDVTKALHRIARHHRMRFSAPVIGITGSRGKTTVKGCTNCYPPTTI